MAYNGEEVSPSEWDEAERRSLDDSLSDEFSEDEDWDFDDYGSELGGDL